MAATPDQATIDELKFNLRESSAPYFTDDELITLLNRTATPDDQGNLIYDVDRATYKGLIMKAEDDSIKLSGLDIPSSQKYFLRLSRLYRKNQGGHIRRLDDYSC